MNKLIYNALLGTISLFALLAQAQQPAPVQVESTIRGNQEQPKTIYVLPWQSPVSVIRIPGQPLPQQQLGVSPLDRQQFLRFIATQQGAAAPLTSQTVNPQKQ